MCIYMCNLILIFFTSRMKGNVCSHQKGGSPGPIKASRSSGDQDQPNKSSEPMRSVASVSALDDDSLHDFSTIDILADFKRMQEGKEKEKM